MCETSLKECFIGRYPHTPVKPMATKRELRLINSGPVEENAVNLGYFEAAA